MLKKKELVRRVARDIGEVQGYVANILDTAFEEIIKILQEGEDLYIHDFGKFTVRTTGESKRVTPTGKEVSVPERKRPAFKFFDSVKETF